MIWVRVTSAAERDADGERNYAITMLEDITERKLAEEAQPRAGAAERAPGDARRAHGARPTAASSTAMSSAR